MHVKLIFVVSLARSTAEGSQFSQLMSCNPHSYGPWIVHKSPKTSMGPIMLFYKTKQTGFLLQCRHTVQGLCHGRSIGADISARLLKIHLGMSFGCFARVCLSMDSCTLDIFDAAPRGVQHFFSASKRPCMLAYVHIGLQSSLEAGVFRCRKKNTAHASRSRVVLAEKMLGACKCI